MSVGLLDGLVLLKDGRVCLGCCAGRTCEVCPDRYQVTIVNLHMESFDGDFICDTTFSTVVEAYPSVPFLCRWDNRNETGGSNHCSGTCTLPYVGWGTPPDEFTVSARLDEQDTTYLALRGFLPTEGEGCVVPGDIQLNVSTRSVRRCSDNIQRQGALITWDSISIIQV